MGLHLHLRDTSLVAYLTIPSKDVDAVGRKAPPRVTYEQLRAFLLSLDETSLISSRSRWPEEVRREAVRCLEKMVNNFKGSYSSFVDAETAAQGLNALAKVLGTYQLYGMAVGTWDDRERLPIMLCIT